MARQYSPTNPEKGFTWGQKKNSSALQMSFHDQPVTTDHNVSHDNPLSEMELMEVIYEFSDSLNYEITSMHVRAILLTEVTFMMTHIL